ncbi:hypothetical protein GIY23_12840 [Allosaccharopolyspora coralli]|uniref:SAF domain-containing protein n=1 Tax=Allosaccharopolyspora coralli TaxID=2665642 RepID=A0A5Q3Q6K9_9PSEU|nr:SAF domain-containing protein [Allosaccharopolyspora coralli]QGK70291.1 hypothetical protein GIY23_12840 [Allosaccharopolyspora coralli]
MSMTDMRAPNTSSAQTNSAPQSVRRESPRVPRRGRTWLLVSAVVLVCAAVAGNAWLFTAAHADEPMLRLARDVGWGQRIGPSDVTTVDLPASAREFAIPESARATVYGQVAARPLQAGALLGDADVSAQTVPGPGEQVVGIRLEPGRIPARGLHPNDLVAVVPVTEQSSVDTGGAVSGGGEFRARVVQSSPPDADGAVTVDVLIESSVQTKASAAAAGGALVIVLGPQQ